MRTVVVILMVFCGTALAQDVPLSPPPAQSFVPAISQTFYLDLDAPEGVYSQWRHDDLGSLSAMRATIRVLRVRQPAKWDPVFSLWLHKTEAGQKGSRLELRLFANHGKPPLVIQIVRFEGGKSVAIESSNKTIGLNENLTVEFSWGTPHTATIKIGDSETHKISVPWSIDSVGVYASTGEMEVDPLVLGNVGN